MPTAARPTLLRPHRRDRDLTRRAGTLRPLAGLLLATCLAAASSAAASAAAAPTPEPAAAPATSPEPAPAPDAGPTPAPVATTTRPAPVEATPTGADDLATALSLPAELAAALLPAPGVPFLGPPEAASRFQAQVTCDPTEKPGVVRLRALLRSTYGRGTTAGISRACSVGGTSHHKEGRAYDWGLDAYDPADAALADALLTWLVGPDLDGHVAGNARRLGLQYVIWDRQIWNASSGVWKPYSGESPHTDHIHFSLSWDGAFGRTSFWTGTSVTQVDHGPCQVYTGILVAPYSAPNYTRCPAPLPPPTNPTGSVETARPDMRSAVLRGWAKDVDTTAPLALHVYVDDRWGGAWTGDRWRADLGGAYGFELRVPLDPGLHRVCVYAINVGNGSTNVGLGCPTVAPLSGDPVGNLERVAVGPGGVHVAGWTLDPDTDAPLATHAYVNGRWAGAWTASTPRPDVAAAYPQMGAQHGISTTLRTPVGRQQVCLYPINVGPGTTNPLLGCREVVALGSDPIGNVEQVRGADGSASVSGWTLDPDVAGSTGVHVYVDGRWGAATTAGRLRPDVAAAYPGWSAERGFSVQLGGLSPGRHQVCAYAIDSGPGTTNPLLSCQDVLVG